MRRLLIPIFTVMLMGPAMADTVVTGSATIHVQAWVQAYASVEAQSDITLSSPMDPAHAGTGSTLLGIHCNWASTLDLEGHGIFDGLDPVSDGWVTDMQTQRLVGGDWVNEPDADAGTDNDWLDPVPEWRLWVSAQPDYEVQTGEIPASSVTVIISLDDPPDVPPLP